MKITIDTKQDSHEDMKHVLEMLTNLLQKGSEPVDTGVMMGMFGSNETSSTETANPSLESNSSGTPTPMSMFNTPTKQSSDSQLFGMSQRQNEFSENKDTAPNFSSLLSLSKEKKEDDEPKVEFF